MNLYEERQLMHDVYQKIAQAEAQVQEGRTIDGDASIKALREKYEEKLDCTEKQGPYHPIKDR